MHSSIERKFVSNVFTLPDFVVKDSARIRPLPCRVLSVYYKEVMKLSGSYTTGTTPVKDAGDSIEHYLSVLGFLNSW